MTLGGVSGVFSKGPPCPQDVPIHPAGLPHKALGTQATQATQPSGQTPATWTVRLNKV